MRKRKSEGFTMAQNTPRRSFRQLENQLTMVIGVHLLLFTLYLVFAAMGITWMKVILAVLAIALSILGCGFLVLIGEHKRRRSLWMLCAFGSIGVCVLVSLLTQFPGPY